MTPLPNMKPIPDGWAAAHRPVAEATMTAPARFLRIAEGPPPYPLPEDWTGEAEVWATDVRVQELKRDGQPVPTEQPTTLREYLITAPLGGPAIRVGERGDVIEAVGRRFNIQSSMAGSLLWEQDFICTENQTQQNP